MKTRLLIMMLLLVSTATLSAQNRPERMNKEQIIAMKWEFISDHAKLSPADALKIQPIFIDYENEGWALLEKNRQAFGRGRRTGANPTIDFELINESFINFDIEKANIQKEYYLKLKKVVSAETIHKLFNADREYRQNLLEKMSRRNRPEGAPKK